ncbi:unnamed protein product, partial [Discosporangium mesarthrocarpum]
MFDDSTLCAVGESWLYFCVFLATVCSFRKVSWPPDPDLLYLLKVKECFMLSGLGSGPPHVGVWWCRRACSLRVLLTSLYPVLGATVDRACLVLGASAACCVCGFGNCTRPSRSVHLLQHACKHGCPVPRAIASCYCALVNQGYVGPTSVRALLQCYSDCGTAKCVPVLHFSGWAVVCALTPRGLCPATGVEQ